MSTPSRAALREINRSFYRRHGRRFGRTRQGYWPGWRDLLPWVDEASRGSALRFFDLGCGNGRYLRFLADHRPGLVIDALGIDLSLPLLAEARSLVPGSSDPGSGSSRWCAGELASWPLRPDGHPPDDLAVSFALLHHLPEKAERERAIETLEERVRPGGVVIVSAWAFDRARFDGKRLSPEEVEARTGIRLPPLEAEDAFFGFGNHPSAVRYCRLIGDRELARLVSEAGLRLVAQPSAPEPNRYAVGVRTNG